MKKILVIFVLCLGITLGGNGFAKDDVAKNPTVIDKSMGQKVFLPVVHMDISYEKSVDQQIQYVFQKYSTRILIRNTDPNYPITLKSIKLYDPDGQLVTWTNQAGETKDDLISTPITLNPLGSMTYGVPNAIPLNDRMIQGRHASIVVWQADNYVNHPNIVAGFVAAENQGGYGMKVNSMMSMDGKIIE